MKRRETLPSLTFENPSDSETGYLSNRSHHGFTLNDKKWMTAEHYIQAMKFAGTSYEDVIREAPTAQKARLLARERNLIREHEGSIIKEKVYGKTKSVRIRDDWKEVEPRIIEEAIRAKFKHHPKLVKKLLQTQGFSLVNSKCRYSGPLLEKLRKEYLHSTPSSSLSTQTTPLKDIPSFILTDEYSLIIDAVHTLLNRIKDEEGAVSLYPGMVEDAMYCLIRKEDNVNHVLQMSEEIGWTTVYTTLPNLKKLTMSIHERLSPSPSLEVGKLLPLSIFLREMSSTSRETVVPSITKKEVMKNVVTASTIELLFLQKHRPYRKVRAAVSSQPNTLTMTSRGSVRRAIVDSDIDEVVSQVKVSESICGYGPDQLAIIAALLHLTKGGKGSFAWAFLLLVTPATKRVEVERHLSKLKLLSGSFEGLRTVCEKLGVTVSEDDLNIIDYAIYYFTRKVGVVSAQTKLFAFAYLEKRRSVVSEEKKDDVPVNTLEKQTDVTPTTSKKDAESSD